MNSPGKILAICLMIDKILYIGKKTRERTDARKHSGAMDQPPLKITEANQSVVPKPTVAKPDRNAHSTPVTSGLATAAGFATL